MQKYLLNEMSWKEAREAFKRTDIAIITSGACHPHGSACPLGSDNIMAADISDRIGKKCVERGIDVIVLPNIPFGYNEYHGEFEGTISIDTPTLIAYYMNVCKWLHKWGIRKLIWNSTHGGNKSAVQHVAFRCRHEFGMLSIYFPWYSQFLKIGVDPMGVVEPDEGLLQEISGMMYVRPDLVNVSEAAFKEYKQPLGETISVVGFHEAKFGNGTIEILFNTKDVTDTGGFGPSEATDYSKASPELGKHMVESIVDYMVNFIAEFKKIKIPPL